MFLDRVLRFVALTCPLAFPAPCLSAPLQTDQGEWEPAFNHVVPLAWQINQALWDGEKLSPFADPLNPHRFMAAHLALIPSGPHRGEVLAMNWMRRDHIHGVQHYGLAVHTRLPILILGSP